jgi:hypothetical protein
LIKVHAVDRDTPLFPEGMLTLSIRN